MFLWNVGKHVSRYSCHMTEDSNLYCDHCGRFKYRVLYYLQNKPHFSLILYFSILLHCIVQWVWQVMFPSAWSFLVSWFPLSFTTFFSLNGYLQVVGLFIYLFYDIYGFYLVDLLVLCLLLRGHTLRVFHLCLVPVLFSFVFFFCVFLQADKRICKKTRRKTCFVCIKEREE
jgi:hypothetical protein